MAKPKTIYTQSRKAIHRLIAALETGEEVTEILAGGGELKGIVRRVQRVDALGFEIEIGPDK